MILHLGLRLGEGLLVALGDLGREGSLGAARLALDEGVVGDDVGRVAGRLAVLAAENADIAGAAAVGLDDLAEPAGAARLGEGEGADHRRRDSLLGRDAGMRGAALDLDFPVLLTDRADDQFRGELAVDVDAHRPRRRDRRGSVRARRAGRSPRGR